MCLPRDPWFFFSPCSHVSAASSPPRALACPGNAKHTDAHHRPPRHQALSEFLPAPLPSRRSLSLAACCTPVSDPAAGRPAGSPNPLCYADTSEQGGHVTRYPISQLTVAATALEIEPSPRGPGPAASLLWRGGSFGARAIKAAVTGLSTHSVNTADTICV